MKFTLSLALAVCAALNAAAHPIIVARQEAARQYDAADVNADLSTDLIEPVYFDAQAGATAYISDTEPLRKLARRQTSTAAAAAAAPSAATAPAAAAGQTADAAENDEAEEAEESLEGADAGEVAEADAEAAALDNAAPIFYSADGETTDDNELVSAVPGGLDFTDDGIPDVLIIAKKKQQHKKLQARQDPARTSSTSSDDNDDTDATADASTQVFDDSNVLGYPQVGPDASALGLTTTGDVAGILIPVGNIAGYDINGDGTADFSVIEAYKKNKKIVTRDDEDGDNDDDNATADEASKKLRRRDDDDGDNDDDDATADEASKKLRRRDDDDDDDDNDSTDDSA